VQSGDDVSRREWNFGETVSQRRSHHQSMLMVFGQVMAGALLLSIPSSKS
jgi:hypothetical protein